MNKLYYAHHLYKYNTQVEEYELELIRRHFLNSEIVNPNGYINQDGASENIMNECLKMVEECNVVVFSDMSGVVGRGVHDEVNRAVSNNLSIYYIMQNKIFEIDNISWEMLNKNNRIYAVPIVEGWLYESNL